MIFFMYFQMTCKFSNYFLLSCYENPFNFHQPRHSEQSEGAVYIYFMFADSSQSSE